ncbi:MAG: glycosyltransferase family 4 protein [Candidatus Komeilibacteria bacterium]
MKIAFIGQKGIPTKFGGVERYVEGVSQNLAKLGHDVFVYTRPYYTNSKKKTWRGVHLISIPSIYTKHLDAISHVFVSTIHALWQDYDVIHYQGVGPSLLSFIPRIFKPKTEVVVTFHSLDRNHAKWNWFARIILTIGEWTACKFPHRTVTVSKGLQKYCLARYNSPTTYIPNGVYSKTAKGTQGFLNKLGLSKYKYFVVVARFIKHKKIEDVMKAFSLLNKDDVKLVIVGDVSFTGEYAKKVKKSAGENVLFLSSLSAEPLFNLISDSLAFVSASEDEGMPISVLEALSLATPVILSNIEGHRDAVEGCYWYDFPVADINALQNRMKYIIRYQSKVRAEAKQNQKLIKENYDWEGIASSLADLYAQEINAPKSWQTSLF